jgi:hypothetical protein
MTIRVVTGYVPIVGFHRTAADFGALGEKLRELSFPVKPFYNQLEKCWLHKFLWEQERPEKITYSASDNPTKNTMAYHIVQHQKFEWLAAAQAGDAVSDTFVWLDYGILHVPGVTVAVIEQFLQRVYADPVHDVVTIPGCWPINYKDYKDDHPNWRFCGGAFVVPRALVKPLALAMRDVTMRGIYRRKNVTWEINDLARVEQKGAVPLRWYQANHDETMFTNYPGGL